MYRWATPTARSGGDGARGCSARGRQARGRRLGVDDPAVVRGCTRGRGTSYRSAHQVARYGASGSGCGTLRIRSGPSSAPVAPVPLESRVRAPRPAGRGARPQRTDSFSVVWRLILVLAAYAHAQRLRLGTNSSPPPFDGHRDRPGRKRLLASGVSAGVQVTREARGSGRAHGGMKGRQCRSKSPHPGG